MIKFENGGCLVESLNELPDLRYANRVYADFETTSGSSSLKSTNPWRNCWVAGIGITVDELKEAWYVPVGHHTGNNLDLQAVADWWYEIITTCKDWTNHNVKYDAQVSANALGITPECSLRCTLTLAKIIDSDRIFKGGYGIDALSKHWLHNDIDKYKHALAPYLDRNKDYGAIPPDICGEYGCEDVFTGRRLDKYITDRMPEECQGVADTETALTPILFEMERNGLTIEPSELLIAEYKALGRIVQLDTELEAIVGRPFRPHVSGDCFDVLINQYGLPVVAWTDGTDDEPEGNPSFSKDALKIYLSHPNSPPNLIEKMLEFRSLNTFISNFVSKFREMNIDNRLHCTYNQCVRTGRLSCKEPNMQQNDKRAKSLIHPREGNSFLSIDYAQIEFRTIVHYIQDEDALAAYAKDKDTDFHMWVADMCGIERRPAKTVNFAIAFGQGEKSTVKGLSINPDVVVEVKGQVKKLLEEGRITEEQMQYAFDKLCVRKGKKVYDDYHNTFPGMQIISRKAAKVVRQKGHVRNLYGRHRHIPKSRAHIAFNTLNQSSAADLIKERTVAVAELVKNKGIRLVATVHDELLMEGPHEVIEDPRTVRDIVACMESPSITMRVPIRCAAGLSRSNWYEACDVAEPVIYESEAVGRLEHLPTMSIN